MNQIRVPGAFYLWIAVIIFGLANSITRRLTQIGAQMAIAGSNPISYCNVLFVGNICALLTLILIYGKDLNFRALKQLSKKDWMSLIGVAILSGALAPSLTFEALSRTMVNNAILIGRLEPPLVLALSVWLLRERVNIWKITGAVVSFAGVIVTIYLQFLWGNMMQTQGFFSLGLGEIMAGAGAVALAVSTIISKSRLPRIPLGIYTVFRTSMGTVIFFCAALYVYGSDHFMEVFSPFLWQWMLVYGAVIIALGQSSWFTGLKKSSASQASLVSSFTPIAGILGSYLILGEAPNLAQYIGGSVILGGIFISQIGSLKKSASETQTIDRSEKEMENNKEMEMGVGFKGV